MKVLANFQVRTDLITKSKISHAQNETYFAKKQKVEHRTMETKSVREEELDKNDQLEEVQKDIGALQND